jgi:hypothetical protein
MVDTGIPINLPEGEIINAPTPAIALNPRNAGSNKSIWRTLFSFMIF